MIELDLLHYLSDATVYKKYSNFVLPHTISREVDLVIKDLEHYFDKYTIFTWPKFSAWFCIIKHSGMSKDTLDYYRTMFTTLATYEPDEEDIRTTVEVLVARKTAFDLATATQTIAEGTAPPDLAPVRKILTAYDTEIGYVDALANSFVTMSMTEILDSVIGYGGLEWRTEPFNISLGLIRRGDFLILGARPDSGKTSLLASEVTYMASQLPEGHKVVWFNNEEASPKVVSRLISCACEVDTTTMYSDVPKYEAEYTSLMGGDFRKIEMVDASNMTIQQIESILDSVGNVGLIVVDQLWKVRGFEKKSKGEVDRLTLLSSWARDIAKIYSPFIGTNQAGGLAEGKEYIEMSDLYMSKTGIQGEADAIITLGRTLDGTKPDMRGLYFPKNKLIGGGSAHDPLRRNDKYQLKFRSDVARFEHAY